MSGGWPLRRIVIAGGGTAGWMTAAALGNTLGHIADIVLVESDAIGTIGVGESTIPPIVLFNNLLGIDEAKFMAATQATFKLGIQFDNWRVPGEGYFHSFGGSGRDHWSAGFQHFWLNGLARGHDRPFADYSLETVAALQGRFAHLPENGLNYAYQLDSTLYAKFLRAFAEKEGVRRQEGRIASVEQHGESGDIAAIVLENGERIEGDLFLDCTGFRALLIGQTLGEKIEGWEQWLLNDRAIAVQTESVGPPVPYTRAIAHDAGWQWRIPLQHRTGNGIVYSSAHLGDDEAEERLLTTIEGAVLTKPNRLKFAAGARRGQWVGNCIAIGLSAGFLEPLESTAIHLIQRAVLRLIRMLPLGEISRRDVAEFNEQMWTDFLQIRDFLILHYKATDRRDSAYWRHCADMEIPDSLEQKIELFRETGRVFRKNEELFQESSWIQVMMGQGIHPRAHHPIATKLSDAELSQFLGMIHDGIARTAGSLPSHRDYLSRYCAADDGAGASAVLANQAGRG